METEKSFPSTGVPYRFTTVDDLRETMLHSPLKQYLLVAIGPKKITLMPHAVRRMRQVADDSDAAMVYCNYRESTDSGDLIDHPVIAYQPGSVRDDFDFGSLVLLNIADVLIATEDFTADESAYLDGGWYALRLRLSQIGSFVEIPEYLYTVRRTDNRLSGEKQHDYVDPRNRAYQMEMEECLANHLYETNALVSTERMKIDPDSGDFQVEVSVVIPVRNRVRTIADAVKSALAQQTDFDFNVIVVDNASTDGTRALLREFEDPRLRLIETDGSEGLGIGGCWNLALLSEHCGRFAVQLDSDDLYADTNVLQEIRDTFRMRRCAMVVGSYTVTDFNLRPIPPGLIDHREWTDANGPNNALRVNGFGAPRAYFTPVAREILFPNVSYGEDYAMCLRISREYEVARIFRPQYNCRRWEGNSDAALSIEAVNAHNLYKDFLRSLEITARMVANGKREDGDSILEEPDEGDYGSYLDIDSEDEEDDDD